jgi:hypothetical protein
MLTMTYNVVFGVMMHTTYDEQPDLDLVAAYLADRLLSPERFSPTETRTGRTPDFRVRKDGEIVAYCEVKSPNDPWLDELLDDAPPLTLVGGARPDPTFNRLSRLLTKADTQFTAVNPVCAELNILAYVNHDNASHYYDLVETLTGYFHSADGTKHLTMLDIAEGRIAETKRRIDVFLWFEGKTGRMAGAVINQAESERLQRTCILLRIDPERIR